jgi:hypothetical protein
MRDFRLASGPLARPRIEMEMVDSRRVEAEKVERTIDPRAKYLTPGPQRR